jgi:hypothetical protein
MGIVQPPQPPPGQVQHQTVVVLWADAQTAPMPGIVLPQFRLTHAEFMTILTPSRVWTGFGGVLCAFALSYALPRVTDLIRSGTKVAPTDWWIIGVIFALGLACFAVSLIAFFSSERRALLKRIRKFFKDNPGQQVYGAGGK